MLTAYLSYWDLLLGHCVRMTSSYPTDKYSGTGVSRRVSRQRQSLRHSDTGTGTHSTRPIST